MIVGGVRNGAAGDDWPWGLNPGKAAIPEKGERTTLLWQSGDPIVTTQLMVPGA